MPVNVQADLEVFYTAIIARASGQQVTQVGHKDKQASYANTPLSEMIRLYRVLWTSASGLPQLNDVGEPVAKRGGPARHWH